MNDTTVPARLDARLERSHSLWLIPLALIPGFSFMVVFAVRSAYASGQWRWTLFDDALISFAYGRTLAETGEWVWFEGADRVQGITNPLWSAVMAVPHLLTSQPTAAIVLMTALTIALMLFLSVLTYRTVLATGSDRATALVAMGSVPFLYPLTFWTLRGMEVGLIAVLACAMVLTLVRIQAHSADPHRGWFVIAGAAGAAAVLTRLDAIVVVLAVVGVGFLLGNRRTRLAWLTVLAGTLAAAGIVLAFQYFYWGDYLPNTYRLKVGGVSFGERVERGVLATARALPLLVMVAVAWFHVRRQTSRHIGASAAMVAVAVSTAVTVAVIGYSIWTGGDAWEWSLMLNRTVSVALPLALIAWLIASRNVGSTPAKALIAIAVSGVGLGATVNPAGFDLRLALIGSTLTTSAAILVWWGSRLGSHPVIRSVLFAGGFLVATCSPGAILWVAYGGLNVAEDQRFALRAQELARVTDEQATIAVMWAGAPGYLTDRAMIDMFGKSDRTIAQLPPATDPATGAPYEFIPGHNKWDYNYSIGQLEPDVVFQLGDDRAVAESKVLGFGYQRGCLVDGWVSYFRTDSPHVRWDEIAPC